MKVDQLQTGISDQDIQHSDIRQRLSEFSKDFFYYTGYASKIGLQRIFRIYGFYLYWKSQERRAYRCSPDYLKEIQWRRFKEILEFAYNRIPFYRDKLGKAGITPEAIRTRQDLERIPILSKDEIRQNFPDRLLDNHYKYKPSRISHTSGSTGESLHFISNEKWKRQLHYNVFLRTGGPTNIRVVVLTTPRCGPNTCTITGENSSRGILVRLSQEFRFLRHLNGLIWLPTSMNILSETDEYMESLAETIAYFSPCIIIADPVYLGSFARYLRRSRKPAPEFIAIIAAYELLTGSLRDLFEEVFGCNIYVQYGASEFMDIANECEYHNLHVRTDLVMVEAIRDGRPVRPGEKGKAIVTDLRNNVMPFIRYDIGDVITLNDQRCRCGRNSDIIESIGGRVSDSLAVNGSILAPLDIDEIFRGIQSIATYRFVQRADDLYHVSIMEDQTFNEADKQLVLERFHRMFGDESQLEIGFVEEIKPEKSTKFRFVYADTSSARCEM